MTNDEGKRAVRHFVISPNPSIREWHESSVCPTLLSHARFEAPKVRNKPAQGKRGTSAALGKTSFSDKSPEGAAHDVAPFQGFVFFAATPGRCSFLACPGLACSGPLALKTTAFARSNAPFRMTSALVLREFRQPCATPRSARSRAVRALRTRRKKLRRAACKRSPSPLAEPPVATSPRPP